MSVRPVKKMMHTTPAREGAGVRLQRAFGFGDTSEFERQLLAAARGDQISPALKQRMAGALAGPLAANTNPPPAGLPASAGAHAGGLLFSKTGLWGVLTLALLAGASSFYALRATAPSKVTSTPLLL